MNQKQARTCMLAAHSGRLATHLLINPQPFDVKWVCSDCSQSKDFQNYDQFTYKTFKQKLDQQQLDFQDKQLKIEEINEVLVYTGIIEQNVKKLKSQSEQLMFEQKNSSLYYKELQYYCTSEINFFGLTNEILQNIPLLNSIQRTLVDPSTLCGYTSTIDEYIAKVNIILNKKKNELQTIDKIVKEKFTFKSIGQLKDKYSNIYAAQISYDEKTLVYQGEGDNLVIQNLKDQSLNTLKQDQQIHALGFSPDSNILYIGTKFGQLMAYDLQYLKLIYSEKIHKDKISDLYPINNQEVLTCSFDKTISKTDILSKEQKFTTIAHDQYVFCIDFCKNDRFLVSASYNGQIKVWNGLNGVQLFGKLDAHPNKKIGQIRIISKLSQIFSLDTQELKIWQYDKQQKSINLLRQIPNKKFDIINFSIVLTEKLLVLLNAESLDIYKINGDKLRTIPHYISDLWNEIYRTRQVDSLSQVIILGNYKILLSMRMSQ
ncbi:hypothetical protein pb186bvf_014452 [Paramecium bursaria]